MAARLSADERREQIVQVGTAIAAERDLRRVPTPEIAEAAGISEGLLFHYFATKQDLALTVYRRAAEDLLADLEAASVAEDPIVRLVTGLGALLDHVQAKSTQWLVLLRRSNDPDMDQLAAEMQDRIVETVSHALTGGAPPPPELLLALRGWLQLEWAVCAQWLEDPTIERATVEAVLLGSFQGTIEGAAAVSPEVAEIAQRLAQALS